MLRWQDSHSSRQKSGAWAEDMANSNTFHHVTFEAHTSVQNIAVGNGRAIENHSLFASRQALSLWHVRYSSMTVWHLCQIIAKIALVDHK